MRLKKKRKLHINNLGHGIYTLKTLCDGDIHRQILKSLTAIENDPNITEKIDFKTIQTKYDEFKRIIHDKTTTAFTNAIIEMRKIASNLHNTPNPKEILDSTKVRRANLIKDFEKADDDLKIKFQNGLKVISEMRMIEVLEKMYKILFGKLIDEKINLLPHASVVTKKVLDWIKKIFNYAYEMYDRFQSKWIELETEISKPFFTESLKGIVTKHPDDKTIEEIENIRMSMIDKMKSALDELRKLFIGDMHNQIFETVKSIEITNLPEIHAKIDLKNIPLKYNQFKQLIQDKLVKRFQNAISELRKLIGELRNKPIELWEKSKDRRNALISELKTADNELSEEIQNARTILLEINVIEVLGKINIILSGKIIDTKIKSIPESYKATKMALQALKLFPNFVHDMYDRFKRILIELELDQLNVIKPFDIEIVGGTIEKYPDTVTLVEIRYKRGNLIEAIQAGINQLQNLYNGTIHKQVLETVKMIGDDYPLLFDGDINLKNIRIDYDKFKKLISNGMLSTFLNPISELRKITNSHRNAAISRDTYEDIAHRLTDLIEQMRTANEELEENLQSANEIIFTEIEMVGVLVNLINKLWDRMPSKATPMLGRVPKTIDKGIVPNKPITSYRGPTFIRPGGEKQPEFNSDDDDEPAKKGSSSSSSKSVDKITGATEYLPKSLELYPSIELKPSAASPSGDPSKKLASHQESRSVTQSKMTAGTSERPSTPTTLQTLDAEPVAESSEMMAESSERKRGPGTPPSPQTKEPKRTKNQ